MKKEPVNITRQTIYAVIPILDLYAAYKIKKFRLYFIIILGIGFATSFAMRNHIHFPYNAIIEEAVTLPIAIYLIRKWSKKWNEQMSESTEG